MTLSYCSYYPLVMTTTTTDAWYPIPGYSSYEINSVGVVRVVDSKKLYPLDTFVPDKSKPDEVSETYTLRHDEEGFILVGKQHLLDVVFKGADPIEIYTFK